MLAFRSKNSVRAASRRVLSGSKFRGLRGPSQHGQQIEKGGQTDRQAVSHRQTDRQTGRQGQTDRQTGRQTDRQADRQAARQTGRQTDRQASTG